MRKLVYYVAMTVNQYIAHEDESIEGFLTEGHHITDYINSLRDYDTVLMGKRTYEWGYQFGMNPGDTVPVYGHMMQYVFSKSMTPYHTEGLQVIQEDAASFVEQLKQQDGGSIYLSGGGKLAGYLLNHGLIDELILKVNPVLFASGIPVLENLTGDHSLALLDTKIYNNGTVFLHYAVN